MFHSYLKADAQPLEPRVPARVRFQLLPTAYAFPPGHCVRLSIAGADVKHFAVSQPDRVLHVHSGPQMQSSISLPIANFDT